MNPIMLMRSNAVIGAKPLIIVKSRTAHRDHSVTEHLE